MLNPDTLGRFYRLQQACERAQTLMERGRNKEAELELKTLITEARHLTSLTQKGSGL